jgi:hypothetical protein
MEQIILVAHGFTAVNEIVGGIKIGEGNDFISFPDLGQIDVYRFIVPQVLGAWPGTCKACNGRKNEAQYRSNADQSHNRILVDVLKRK